MAQVKFHFEELPSELFGSIWRPYATVDLQGPSGGWIRVRMVIDTGADYTVLPASFADDLGIDLARDCTVHTTRGVGGHASIYLYKGLIAQIGDIERTIPVGFLEHDDVPALLGRHEFFETFRVVFENHETVFESESPLNEPLT